MDSRCWKAVLTGWKPPFTQDAAAGCKIMEIIKEGPSVFRPPVLDDGRAWRALVAGYEPPMTTVDGVLVPKPEFKWTDAEEQASMEC
ncbi:gag-pol polyprotein [Cucumis melo var. makuwa]|uniref:Gag-pol polyprotein n=1 Tax=Cucumis melo var. makuwa TaxID=1194695 RepID=A0A5D3E6L3_CUCMM|nr:gag-pol polyprotein [Cucumis melo var. makuwa]TYK31624.1 gag-pol polyprotein [Cucumis melo var. makuwa]